MTIEALAEQIKTLDDSVTRLREAVERRTHARAVVTSVAAVTVALLVAVAGLFAVREQIAGHTARDHDSWCLVWRLLDGPEAAAQGDRDGCRSGTQRGLSERE